MRAKVTSSAPCELAKGELRRVPQNRQSHTVGYHVCCPRCGFVSTALEGKDSLSIDEGIDGRVTFSRPLRCIYCQVLIHIERCELTLEEDKYVRPLRFR